MSFHMVKTHRKLHIMKFSEFSCYENSDIINFYFV